MAWQCFVMEPTDRVVRALRRYSRRDVQCPASGATYHNAKAAIEPGPLVDHGSYYATEPQEWSRDDPRWPTHCACGYEFTDDDPWQLWYEAIYLAPDGTEHTIRDMPIGAMWRAKHMEGTGAVGPDGQCWVVQLPPGGLGNQWMIDYPSSSGGRWTRTGEPPLFTAQPSILTPHYHGWLTNGVLSDHVG